MASATDYILQTKRWIDRFVIGLELCPFAAEPFMNNSIGYSVLLEDDLQKVAHEILRTCNELQHDEDIETRFIITPNLGLDFKSFYELTTDLQAHLDEQENSNMVLVAFHPDFHYHGSEPDDITNSTNQSPLPMVHLLRPESMEMAERSEVNIGQLLRRNQTLLGSMSPAEIRTLYQE